METTREEYYDNHRRCPSCGNANVFSTTLGVGIPDKTNTASCKCGWRGVFDDFIGDDEWAWTENKGVDNIEKRITDYITEAWDNLPRYDDRPITLMDLYDFFINHVPVPEK